jgi:U3 small nucleolar RNA-associated protein 5
MGRKSSTSAVSKISSASMPAVVSSSTTSSQRSSVLKSAFAPSQFQLHLFASVIQSFDAQHLRIHDTNTGRLRCQHEVKPGSKISCLDWGYYGAAYRAERQSSSKKKRKRDQDNHEGAVVAYGTSTSEICIFSPTEGKIVGMLRGAYERGVTDFRFSRADYNDGWSLGDGAKLVQWDLSENQPIRFVHTALCLTQGSST